MRIIKLNRQRLAPHIYITKFILSQHSFRYNIIKVNTLEYHIYIWTFQPYPKDMVSQYIVRSAPL